MNTKVLWGIIAVILAILLVVMFTRGDRDRVLPDDNDEIQAVEDALNRLPHAITVGERTVELDGDVEQTDRAEFSFRQATTLPQPEEDPIDYIERILRIRLAAEPVVSETEFYDFAASFYRFGDNGISAFVQISNIPDDSVGATEERFDLVFENDQWRLDWYGLRHFCRRPNQEFWAPADQLCP